MSAPNAAQYPVPPLGHPGSPAYVDDMETAETRRLPRLRLLTSKTKSSMKLSDCPAPLDVRRTPYGYGLKPVDVGEIVADAEWDGVTDTLLVDVRVSDPDGDAVIDEDDVSVGEVDSDDDGVPPADSDADADPVLLR